MDRPSTESGQEAVIRAREAAERRDWDEAYEAYGSAESLLGPADLYEWATAAYLLGRVDTAVDALARAHHLYRENGDVPAALRCGFWVVFILLNRGAMGQASGWLGRCNQLVEGFPTGSAEAAYMRLVEAFRLTAVEDRYTEGHQQATEVVEVARRTREGDLLGLSLNVAGRALIKDGRSQEGLTLLDEAMVALISGELSPAVVGTVYCSLIEACDEVSELRRAREWTDALTRWCDQQKGMITFTGQCLTHRSNILRRKGEWKAAAEEAERARRRFVGAADEMATGKAMYELAEVQRVVGDLEEAEESYRVANEWGHDPQPGLALLRLSQGNREAASATMRRLISETDTIIERSRLLPAHVEVMLAVGDVAAAADAAVELKEVADALGTSALRAEARYALGAVALTKGEAEGALSHLRQAAEMWRSLETPYETARARVLIGLACQVLEDHDGAALELDAARAAFTRLGAGPDLEKLTELGPRPDAAQTLLSPRELEVLRLVATGMTNQEVANELFLAVKTVDRHVGNILTKLGVPSRTAATAYAYERHLL